MMTTMLKSCSLAETLMCKYIRGIRLKEKPEPLESVVWAQWSLESRQMVL